ncbi:MAG: pitrilysin family protein [Pseudomonadota bacterium]|nr:pitrilysin family protein [Pseudomonadota bacterium]
MIRFSAVFLSFMALFSCSGNTAVFNPESHTLSNGMQVVVVTNRSAPAVVHMVWYKVGAADEPRGQSGIAHFLEHLMFKGTKHTPPGEFSKIVSRNGGTDNAFTSQDFTAYYQKVARNKLELVMKLEAERMTKLVLTDKEVLPERDVVLEERSSRTDNSPAAQLFEAQQAALYLNHPYRHPVIGWEHEIRELSTENALRFYKKFYAPNNAILIVSGDVSLEEIKPLAEKYYGSIPVGAEIVRTRSVEPRHRAARRVSLSSAQVRQPSFSRIYIASSYRTAQRREAYALQVLAEILGGGTRSRLYRSLVLEQKKAISASVWYNPTALDYGEFGISVTPRGNLSLSQIEKALDRELLEIKTKSISSDEIRRAAKRLTAEAVYARDSLMAAPNIIGRALTTGQSLEDIEEWPERIMSVRVSEIVAAANKTLVLRNSVTSLLTPEKKEGH